MNTIKHNLVRLLSAVLICSLFFLNAVPAQAYRITGYTLNGGVGNYGYNTRYYYVDSSCTTSVTSKIASAWSDWIFTTNSLGITTPISVKKTTTKSSSVFDFYYKKQFEASEAICGETYMYTGQNLINPDHGNPDRNWGWTQIILNKPTYDLYGVTDIDHPKSIIAHEIGHAMGLCHYGETYCLMYAFQDEVETDKCTVDELNGINALY